MPKIKVPRSNPSLDMTPMVDLAFLLVTFFMLTASFRTEEAIVVDAPKSVSDEMLPDNAMMVTMDTAGRAFYTIDGEEIKKNTLMQMGEKYSVTFSEDEIKEFQLMKDFGHPFSELKTYLNATKNERTKMDKNAPGIPMDSLNNELGDWITFGKISAYGESQTKGTDFSNFRYSIKADARTDFRVMRKLFNAFEKSNIHTFDLVTNLEQE